MVALDAQFQPGGSGTLLQWRIYSPAAYAPNPGPGPWPAVLLEHGGGFRSGSPFLPAVEKVAEILAKNGFYTLVPCYRLAPCGRIPGQIAHDDSTEGKNSGRPSQQTDDVMFEVLAARADNNCNGKVGIVGSSSGGTLALYVALYTKTINESGRPPWNQNGQDNRPNCAVTFSAPCDLADQQQNDDINTPGFIGDVQNYVGSCLPAKQRQVSPVALVTFNIKNFFKPLYLVHASEDHVVPFRQLSDMECALTQGEVDTDDYKIVEIRDENHRENHALNLWRAPLPDDPNKKVGGDVMEFLHDNLD